MLNLQRLGSDTTVTTNPPTINLPPSNPPTSEYLKNESRIENQEKVPQKEEEEDSTSGNLAPTRTIGVGRIVRAPWIPGPGCMLDESSPKKIKNVTDDKAEKIIKDINEEQARGLKQGLRLEKQWDGRKEKSGADMFSDQYLDPKVSSVSVMYETMTGIPFYNYY